MTPSPNAGHSSRITSNTISPRISTTDVAVTRPMTATSPISILFVCLGNICRSPMAHAVFLSLTSSHPRVGLVDSAGTGAYHTGSDPDPRTMHTLAEHGIHDYTHAARKVYRDDFDTFDYILAMDEENLEDLLYLRGRAIRKHNAGRGKREVKHDIRDKGKVMLFGDFGGRVGEVIGDPYYGANDGFEVAHEQCVRFSKGFVKELLEKD